MRPALALETPTHDPSSTPYDRLGGEAGVRRLVERFYALMDELPEAYTVRQIHPESLAGSADSLFKYLSGWFGGPPLYTAEKGHPRLRMRHLPYRVGPVERDEWMLCMRQALAETVDDAPLRAVLEKALPTWRSTWSTPRARLAEPGLRHVG
jgi:hemoglobin